MATKTSTPPATRLPFRVLIRIRKGPELISEPLDETDARLLVRGVINGGDAAEMVENHGPRHREAEAIFTATSHVRRATVLGGCNCGKCLKRSGRLAAVSREPTDVSPETPAREEEPVLPSLSLGEKALGCGQLVLGGLGGMAAAVVLVELIKRVVSLCVGGQP